MRISLIQTNIIWENKEENLKLLNEKLETLRNTTDIVVLPEMFSTGFSMNSRILAEPVDGPTITTLKKWAKEYHFAITGSYISSDNHTYYNRAFFLAPSSESLYYDKDHLFRTGE